MANNDPSLSSADYTPADVGWLPEDLTGENPANWISDEIHPIPSLNSSAQRLIIMPFYGAFYYDNYLLAPYTRDNDSSTPAETNTASNTEQSPQLTVVLVKNGVAQPLVRDSDYHVRGLDIGRTQASSSKYGVYEYILLTRSIVQNILDLDDRNDTYIKISYHAFGGNVNYRNLRIDIAQLYGKYNTLLQENERLNARVTALEEQLNTNH